MPNFAALRAAVFELSAKNLRGGRIPAPPSVRGLRVTLVFMRHFGHVFDLFAAYWEVGDGRREPGLTLSLVVHKC